MNRLEKLISLKIQLQIGLIRADKVVKWIDSQLLECSENDPELIIFANASTAKDTNELIDSLNAVDIEFNNEIELALVKDLLVLAKESESGASQVAHCMEHIELLGFITFQNKAPYFKCAIEDIDAGVYGNIELLRDELVEYLEAKYKTLEHSKTS